MNSYDVYKLAKQVGMGVMITDIVCTSGELERFAELVAAAEREACANFCESNQVFISRGKRGFSPFYSEDLGGGRHDGMDYAEAIRARGQS